MGYSNTEQARVTMCNEWQVLGSGDVKYHLGYSNTKLTGGGKEVRLFTVITVTYSNTKSPEAARCACLPFLPLLIRRWWLTRHVTRSNEK